VSGVHSTGIPREIFAVDTDDALENDCGALTWVNAPQSM
jgi:hypothetical protein